MKKSFNHTKRPADDRRKYDRNDYEWEEELEYVEGGEDYAQEEPVRYEDGEDYAQEGAAYYEDARGDAGEGAAYYGDGEGDAQEGAAYYEDARGDAGESAAYYENGEDDARTGAGYDGDAEGYAGEVPLYVEDLAEDEGLEISYEDTEIYNAEYHGEEPVRRPKRKKEGFWGPLKDLSLMDKVIAVTGVAVLVLALATGAAFISSRIQQAQVSDFVSVGAQLKDIALIGEDGLIAVADARMAQLNGANQTGDDDEGDDPGYDENEYERQVTVGLNMTSIQKDLKIKFTNQKTDKLVAHVPFSVKVTDPDGKTSTWSDDDMDGIIHKKDIVPGTYEVAMEELADQDYAGYTISTAKKSVVVKKDISYKKVDVSNEIKTEKEIDSKKEDTARKDTEVEGVLQDTVAWVESKKLPVSYTEVPKSTISDPLLRVSLDKGFLRMALTAAQTQTLTVDLKPDESIKLGDALNLKGCIKVTSDDANETVLSVEDVKNVKWSCSEADKETIELAEDGTVKGKKAGEATVSFAGTASVKVEKPEPSTEPSEPTDPTEPTEPTNPTEPTEPTDPANPTEPTDSANPTEPTDPANPTNPTENPGAEAASAGNRSAASISSVVEETREVPVQGTIKVKVSAPAGKGELSVEKKELAIVIKGTATVQAAASKFAEGKKLAYKVTSDNEAVAKAAVDENGKVTVTGVAAGKAKITVTVDYADAKEGDGTAVSATIDVTVGANKTIKLDPKTATVYVNHEKEVAKAVITGTSSQNGVTTAVVTAVSSDVGVLEVKVGTLTVGTDSMVTASILVKPLKEGSATITVVCKENGEEVKETCTVTVKKDPKTDTTTELKDDSGTSIYVMENGKYRKATNADYYTYDKFFVQNGEKYTGWQTLNGKVYFFKADGTKVTGEQVIQGARYNFASDGSLVTGNGTVGIDVSKWNGTIDWEKVKNSGISYVIIRCGYRGSTQGKLVVDPKFEANIKGATAAGLKVGVYFFTQAVDEREAVEEASMVLELVKNYRISYPIFLDVEASGGRADSINKSTRTAVCKAFCETIQNAGYTAGIYANKTWLTNKLDANALSAYKIWLAQYASTPTYTGRYDLWQYRSTGKVSGISGDVDMNQSYLGY